LHYIKGRNFTRKKKEFKESVHAIASVMSCEHKDCGCEVFARCIEPVLQYRLSHKGEFGSLGACVFEEAQSFFKRAVRDASGKPPAWNFEFSNMICIGDVHGDLTVLLSVLRMMGVIDDDCHFALKEQTLIVQLGDMEDSSGRGCPKVSGRYEHDREVVDVFQFMHALRKEALASNGSYLVTLLGNHSLFRLQSDAAQSHDSYIGDQWKGWSAGWQEETSDVAQKRRGLSDMRTFFNQTMRSYYAAYFPLFVRNLQFVCMHGGISEAAVRFWQRVHNEKKRADLVWDANLRTFDYLKQDPFTSTNNEMWNDFLSEFTTAREPMNPSDPDVNKVEKEAACLKMLPMAQAMFRVKAFVFAHTPQSEIVSFCDGKVFRLDFAMSFAFCHLTTKSLVGLFVHQDSQSQSRSFTKMVQCSYDSLRNVRKMSSRIKPITF
jgi:hypothetical protein